MEAMTLLFASQTLKNCEELSLCDTFLMPDAKSELRLAGASNDTSTQSAPLVVEMLTYSNDGGGRHTSCD
jgi:hypothetical protein